MSFYLFIYFILFCFSLIEVLSNNIRFSRFCFIILLLGLFVLSFIRWETGTDWYSYRSMYEWIRVPWENIDPSMELGFSFVNHLAKYLFNSYTGVLFLFALIIFTANYKVYLYFSKYPITVLLFSFCITFANIFFVRQGVACAILLASIIYIEKKQFRVFFLFVLFAALFHRSSWVFLLAYPIFWLNLKTKQIFLILIGSCLFSYIGSEVLFSTLGNLGMGVISKKIEAYVEMGVEDNSMTYSTKAVILKGLINRIFLTTIILYFLNNIRRHDIRINGFINIYCLGTVLYCTTMPLSISLARMAVYMDLVQLFIVAIILYRTTLLRTRLVLFCFFSVYYLTRLISAYGAFKDEYTPFMTIFNS